MTDGLERAFATDDARAGRRFTVLTTMSVGCGVGAFVTALWMSQLLVPVGDQPVELGGTVIFSGLLFVALVAACILLGYVAARGRAPRRD